VLWRLRSTPRATKINGGYNRDRVQFKADAAGLSSAWTFEAPSISGSDPWQASLYKDRRSGGELFGP
jgi:hypothetical protein